VAEQANRRRSRSGSGTILLVEDDAMVRTMTTQMLEALAIRRCRGRSAEALSLFEQQERPSICSYPM